MTQVVSSYDAPHQIGLALTTVSARVDGARDELRELRRELVIHRSEQAEERIAEAAKLLEYAGREVRRAIDELVEKEEEPT